MGYCEYCHDASTYYCKKIQVCEGYRTSVCKECGMSIGFKCRDCGSSMVEEDELEFIKKQY